MKICHTMRNICGIYVYGQWPIEIANCLSAMFTLLCVCVCSAQLISDIRCDMIVTFLANIFIRNFRPEFLSQSLSLARVSEWTATNDAYTWKMSYNVRKSIYLHIARSKFHGISWLFSATFISRRSLTRPLSCGFPANTYPTECVFREQLIRSWHSIRYRLRRSCIQKLQ